MGEAGVRQNSTAASVIANDRKRKKIDDHAVTGAGEITLRQSILPVCLVTILFFMWGFAYGLLDVLNAHFQTALQISQGMSGGLQAAYCEWRPGVCNRRIMLIRDSWCLLHWSSNLLRIHRPQIWVSMDFHCRSVYLWCRRLE